METANVILSFFSAGAGIRIAMVLLTLAFFIAFIPSRENRISIFFYRINRKLRDTDLPPNIVFYHLKNIPLKRWKVEKNADESRALNKTKLDEYIDDRIKNAVDLREFFNNISGVLNIKKEKRRALHGIIESSIKSMAAEKLADLYTDCIYHERDGTTDFESVKRFILKIIALNDNKDARAKFARNVIDSLESFLTLRSLKDEEKIIIQAAEIKLKKSHSNYLKNRG